MIVTVTMNAALDRTLTVPHFQRGQRHRAAIHDRTRLRAGQTLPGPAIVEQDDTTVLVPRGFVGTVDAFGNITITALAGA